MPPAFPTLTAGQQQADLIRRITRLRWAGVALSFLLVSLTDPRPVLPIALYGVTLVVAGWNVYLWLAHGARARHPSRMALLSVAIDFVFISAWVALTGNDPAASNYVMYMIVGVEAAILFLRRGALTFIAAFVATFGLVYAEKALIFHEHIGIGSMIFRFAVVIIMTLMASNITSASEERRARAEAAALEALRESERLETVHRMARGVGASLRRDDVLESVVGSLRTLFPERWSGVLLEDGKGKARLCAATGDPHELEIPVPPEERLPPVEQTLRIENFWNSVELNGMGVVPPSALREYTTATIVPLHVGGRRLGGLVTLGREGDQMDDEDVRLLEAVAPQLSTALDNARLYEETEGLALTDTLTRLGNRRAFEQRLEEEIQRARRHGGPLSLVVLDIDHFKVYNDSHGHQAGDEILRRLGDALSVRLLRGSDVAYRYGGEEFAVIMPQTTAEQAEAVMLRGHEMLALEPLPLGEHQPGGHVTMSVGVTAWEAPDVTSTDLFEQADLALFDAKLSGRNCTVVYTSELAASLTNWTTVLPHILETQALHAVYQPIVSLSGGALFGYEALARADAHQGVAGVEGMFAAAQRMGMLHDLDWLCFRAAVAGAGALRPGQELFVNITLSALLNSSRDPEYMAVVLESAGRSARDVVFELSEREAITDMPRLRQILASYRELGMRFAIDDVGEGHSTFELLAAASPEYVKIARSLVLDGESSGPAGTIRALVEFGRATGARVVAEGIEDSDVAQRMRNLGVEFGQGFGLGLPAALPQALGDVEAAV
ncbi:MAG: diguanylate cyclase [Candidatus Dormibacteria bacterium]